MSLGAWRQTYPLDEYGKTELRPGGRLSFTASGINQANRRRAIGRFRRLHGEAVFELPTGDTSKGPHVARTLWISVDPTSRKWRVTRVSHRGPEGHTEFRSWDDAVYDALVDYPKAHLGAVVNVRDSDVGKVRSGGLIG